MRVSTKCSTALHALLVIAVISPKKKVTGEFLAKSAGCNPVIIRNILGRLKSAGIIDIARGTGGATLRLEPKDITLWDVYSAVDNTALDEWIGLHPNPSQKCPVGKNIYALLAEPYGKIGAAIKREMTDTTLEQLLAAQQKEENRQPL